MRPATLDLPPDLIERIRAAASARRQSPAGIIGEALTFLDAGNIGLEPMSSRIADRSIAGFETCSRAAAALAKELRSETPDAAFVLELLTCIDLNYASAVASLCAVIQGAGECTGTA